MEAIQLTTDPAMELVQLCDALSQDVNAKGEDFLASKFEVDPNSYEFFRIVATIQNRIDYLDAIVSSLSIDVQIKEEASRDLHEIRQGFQTHSFLSNWKAPNGPGFLRRENTRLLKGLSSEIKRVESYPILSAEDVADFLYKLEALEKELSTETIYGEPDFIGYAILEGISEFKFSIKHLKWMGWSSLAKSVDKLFHAYMVLERKMPEDVTEGSAHTTMRLLKSLLEAFLKKAEQGKTYWELGRFYLDVVGATTLLGLNSTIAGLLPSS